MQRVRHLRLVPRTNRETILLARSILAEAETGEVTDLCLTYRRRSGVEDVAFSGVYRRDPAQALQAAILMSSTLTRIAAAARGNL